ncbi:hypothetical protein RGQ29_028354 [Quercus rubra]|uniref:RING-type E3 ubiquitin transferase n=1 Tax=Quercus rubra TaxID=3512 RepID=A0AAN7ERJ2_QUERU|nr:hypothetical protein RGQ29_028354 [Quercus rubra]
MYLGAVHQKGNYHSKTSPIGYWGKGSTPYSNSQDFEANTATVLIVLLCALICALRKNTLEKDATDSLIAGSSLLFSTGMKLAGVEVECAICLSEFVEGEGIRVLGRCNHGFHVNCIQQWLSSHTSCPTCRCSCLPPSPIPTQPYSQTNTEEGQFSLSHDHPSKWEVAISDH